MRADATVSEVAGSYPGQTDSQSYSISSRLDLHTMQSLFAQGSSDSATVVQPHEAEQTLLKALVCILNG